jgi:hypothetical protein
MGLWDWITKDCKYQVICKKCGQKGESNSSMARGIEFLQARDTRKICSKGCSPNTHEPEEI